MLHLLNAIGGAIRCCVVLIRKQVVVAVASSNAQGRAADQHARPGYIACVNSIPQRHIAVSASADITHRRKTRFKREPRVVRASKRFSRNGYSQSFISEMWIEGEMGVRIDQPRQNGGVRQINYLVAGRSLKFGSGSDTRDLVTFNHNGLIGENFSAPHVQQLARAQNRALSRLRRDFRGQHEQHKKYCADELC